MCAAMYIMGTIKHREIVMTDHNDGQHWFPDEDNPNKGYLRIWAGNVRERYYLRASRHLPNDPEIASPQEGVHIEVDDNCESELKTDV